MGMAFIASVRELMPIDYVKSVLTWQLRRPSLHPMTSA